MKTIVGTTLFIMVLAASTARSDVVLTDIGTNESSQPIVFAPSPQYLPSDLRHFLEGADQFTLYSLKNDFERNGTNTFFDHPILGQIKIEKTVERTNLVTALGDGIAGGCIPADCFEPRHGIRAVKNGVAVDFLICFECGTLDVFSTTGTNWSFSVCSTPTAAFNKVLKSADIPLSP
jgi:hypothetical protein